MYSWLAIGLVSLILYYCFTQYRSFSRNLTAAKQSGFAYTVTPVFIQQISWVLTQNKLLLILNRLPRAWTESWLPVSVFAKIWHQGYGPFERIGEDTFMVVSPTRNVLWTCDPRVILQVLSRRNDFPKPVMALKILNLHRPTITGTEGPESRLYRKITSPFFNDETHQAVWTDSLQLTQQMMKSWLDDEPVGHVLRVNQDTARLTLCIISRVCFGRKLEYVNEKEEMKKIPPGHTMTYNEAVTTMLEIIGVILFAPPLLLKKSPLPVHKNASESFTEWRKYMEEMRDETRARLHESEYQESMNLLESLVRAGENTETSLDESTISPAAINGNIFIFILAGFETSANTLTYAIILLACYPQIQRQLQENLDQILGTRPPSQWTYKSDFPELLNGYPGAILNETTRLYTVLPCYPKSTGPVPQSLTVNNRTCTVPALTTIFTNTSATHRNPKYWPPSSTLPSPAEGPPYPVSSFDPSRWVRSPPSHNERSAFQPEPGTFIPFSEGPRSCLGQRFAQAEFCAVLARVFRDHSVELKVDGNDKGAWETASQDAERELSSGVGFMMALKMMGRVNVSIVKRG